MHNKIRMKCWRHNVYSPEGLPPAAAGCNFRRLAALATGSPKFEFASSGLELLPSSSGVSGLFDESSTGGASDSVDKSSLGGVLGGIPGAESSAEYTGHNKPVSGSLQNF